MAVIYERLRRRSVAENRGGAEEALSNSVIEVLIWTPPVCYYSGGFLVFFKPHNLLGKQTRWHDKPVVCQLSVGHETCFL